MKNENMKELKDCPDMFTDSDYVNVTRKTKGMYVEFKIMKKEKLSTLDKILKYFGNKTSGLEFSYDFSFEDNFSRWVRRIIKTHSIEYKLWDCVKSLNDGNEIILSGNIIGSSFFFIHFELHDIKFGNKYLDYIDVSTFQKTFKLPEPELLYQGLFDEEKINNIVKEVNSAVVIKCVTNNRDRICKII